jgi:hypothetical protein
MINEARGCYRADGVSENRGVGCDKSFKVSRCWCWATAPGIEILGYHFLDETGIIVELATHFGICVFACKTSFLAALDDELEALVELVLDLFAVLEVFLWILFEVFELFFAVCDLSVSLTSS